MFDCIYRFLRPGLDQNIPNANICTDLPTYTYPDPKDGDEPAFVATQVFIFETIQWISMEFGIERSTQKKKNVGGSF